MTKYWILFLIIIKKLNKISVIKKEIVIDNKNIINNNNKGAPLIKHIKTKQFFINEVFSI